MPHLVSLVTLRIGLQKLTDATREKKEAIQRRLSRSEKISREEEDWLDNEANHVDEQALVHALQEAPSYDAAFNKLSPTQYEMVQKLEKLAIDGTRTLAETAQAVGKLSGSEQLEAISKKRKSELLKFVNESESKFRLKCRANRT